MSKKISIFVVLLLLGQIMATSAFQVADAAENGMTKYRVYQNDKALREFATEAQAKAYAKYYNYSHVETIAGRNWIWDNFPRYKVYQNGKSTSTWDFHTYDQALALAKTLSNAHIRDLQNIGWEYQSFVKYRLYQGDKTLSNWSFTTLDAAKKEAKKWNNAHVIDLTTNKWVWDNLTPEQKKTQKEAKPVYQISVDGTPVEDQKLYSYLLDAINASTAFKNSVVINTVSDRVVHSNVPEYLVQVNGEVQKAFISLEAAVQFAEKTTYAEVTYNGNTLWSGVPYLEVYQGNKKLKYYNTRQAAVNYAKYYSNSSVRTTDGRTIWSNAKSLVYLGWNGSSSSTTIMNHVTNTQGLSIDSPTWFELSAADGSLKDMSDPQIVKTLKEKGILVTPLVHNQFDRKMTSEFLKNTEAQKKFVTELVDRLAVLGVYGVNLDFEEVAAADRTAYTAFVDRLTKAAHAKKLKVSIDLPRGSVSWNHKTAYDHAALGSIVDTIIIMAYDEHWKGSPEPGSTAGLAWTEEGVKQFLDYGIPRSKLMLGIPFYVREWRLDSIGNMIDNRAIFMKEIPKLIEETNAVGVFDPESGQLKYTYNKDGLKHVFWAETEETIVQRINIAKKYDLAGVAAWRLGYESSDLWTRMLRMK